ncbi:hypothetical protein TWF481_005911 [Arthrobotrys musiformis]|uniref:Uncharacterized protein n=1 Tax=Arthrobotrys musiformis TaxID=47236 RepID=A0AAV9WF37_9PEZI
MPAAPIAKGVIIMCAVLIAAGYTVYENREQVKEIVDRTRRKISLAMHTFAEEIMPSEGPRQRQPMAFSGRSLDSSGHIHRPNSRNRSRRNSTDSSTLRGDDEKAEGSSRDAYLADSALRYRPPYRGSAEDPSESSSLNAAIPPPKPSSTPSPFDDDNRVLFDADQHILNEKTSLSPGSDTSSDTLPPAMSEKGIEITHDAPPMIPAVLPTIIDQPPPLPPRPSHPQYQEIPPVLAAPAVLIPTIPQPQEDPEPEPKEPQNTYLSPEPHWAIQKWTEDVTNQPNADEDEPLQPPRTPSRAALSSSDSDSDDDSDALTTQSLSEAVSIIGSDEAESEDDRVEFASDFASSVGDTDGWSEVGSQFSDTEGRM